MLNIFAGWIEPKSGFHIAFNMFDTDGNARVDKQEFMVVSLQQSLLINVSIPGQYYVATIFNLVYNLKLPYYFFYVYYFFVLFYWLH